MTTTTEEEEEEEDQNSHKLVSYMMGSVQFTPS
jgi:hypothetical protein